MKRILLSMCFLLLGMATSSADNYQVVKISSGKVYIKGKELKEKDTISSEDLQSPIKWEKKHQAVWLYNTTSKKRAILRYDESLGNNKPVIEYFFRRKHLSTDAQPDENPDIIRKLEIALDDEYVLWEPIEIETDVDFSAQQYVVASYMYGESRIINPLKCQGKKIIIDKNIFYVDNEKLEPRDLSITIIYVDKNKGTDSFIKSGISLFIVDEQ